MTTKTQLYSAWYCPFAQRAWMALLKNNISFDYIETDPYDKNAQWMEISKGAGQVPVLVDGDLTLTDSSKILTDIDKNQFAPSYLVNAQFWMDLVNTQVIPYFYRYLKAQTTDEQQYARDKMLEGLAIFSDGISDIGPYFSGAVIGPVDLAFIPFAYRIDLLLKHYRNFSLDKLDPVLAKYHSWYQNMTATEIFIKTSISKPDYESNLIQFYKIYSEGGGQKDVTDL
jgi:glutathione S-transferase